MLVVALLVSSAAFYSSSYLQGNRVMGEGVLWLTMILELLAKIDNG